MHLPWHLCWLTAQISNTWDAVTFESWGHADGGKEHVRMEQASTLLPTAGDCFPLLMPLPWLSCQTQETAGAQRRQIAEL